MGSVLQISPENAYMSVFGATVEKYYAKLTVSPALFLSDVAKAGLEKAYYDAAYRIAEDTMEEWNTAIIARENPFVRFDRNLCTKKQREEAALILKAQLESGEQVLPDGLMSVIHARFRILTDALSEMIKNISEKRKEISNALFEGREYTGIKNITVGAGDYHNYARSASFIETDAGKMLYKPRNCRVDVSTWNFVQKYFPDHVRIPKCFTDGKTFGVCEYLPPEPARGGEEAGKWFYALGELTVLVQLLGSYDMHFENITASKGLPALIDLETILRPRTDVWDEPVSEEKKSFCFMDEVMYSVWPSALLPKSMKGKQLSVLLRTEGEGNLAPVVCGNPVTVFDYREDFFAGLESAYRRCLAKKEELKKDVEKLFSDAAVRLMLRNSSVYSALMTRLYKASVLSSEKKFTAFSRDLEEALIYGRNKERYEKISQSETAAIMRGDIPYFYAPGNSHDICDADGRIPGRIQESGVEVSIQRISRMSEQELQFEKQLIKEALDAEAGRLPENDKSLAGTKGVSLPGRRKEALPDSLAVREAELILREIRSRMIISPGGCGGWIATNGSEGSPEIMRIGMFNGTTGIGVFAAAAASVSDSEEIVTAGNQCMETAVCDIEKYVEALRKTDRTKVPAPLADNLGEASGMAGILRSLALMNQYSGCFRRYTELLEEVLDLLMTTDISAITGADRIGGLAGILSVLCDFPEFARTERGKALITAFSDRLMELKRFDADGYKQLWKTVSERHLISGAGHGMAGIGEALHAAGRLLGEQKYLDAAADALKYEGQAYNEKMGTWPDNRTWPSQQYMHGYCSGAPGIGIMVHRILERYAEAEERNAGNSLLGLCDRCAGLSRNAVERLPLLYRDHLCCGNSAIVEYYLSIGEKEEAGRVLNSMFLRKEKNGSYRIHNYGYRNAASVSLFFGIAGIGYEMLRYAFPDRIQPLV